MPVLIMLNFDILDYYFKGVVNKGESYFSENEDWYDLSKEESQEMFLGEYYDYDYAMDNFPIKAYLEPVTFKDKAGDDVKAYLTIYNWADGKPGTFNILNDEEKTVSAEIRGIKIEMPEAWKVKYDWESTNEDVMTVTPKGSSPNKGSVVIKAVSEGKANLIMHAVDNYNNDYGTRVISVKVRKPSIAVFDIDLEDYKATYTGKPIEPAVKDVMSVEKTGDLEEGTDYIVSYENNVNVGKASVTVSGTGEYGGSVAGEFDIVPADISKAEITGIADKTYTGAAVTQSPVVKFGGATLKEGSDYSLTYKDNTNAGTASIEIKGKGNFDKATTKTFKIAKAANPLSVAGKTAKVKYSKVKKKTQKLAATKVMTFKKAGQGKMTYEKVNVFKQASKSSKTKKAKKKSSKNSKGKYYSKIGINKTTGQVTVKKGLPKGKYKVKAKVTAAGNANYKASAAKNVTFTINVK